MFSTLQLHCIMYLSNCQQFFKSFFVNLRMLMVGLEPTTSSLPWNCSTINSYISIMGCLEGFEPPSFRFVVCCSSIELQAQWVGNIPLTGVEPVTPDWKSDVLPFDHRGIIILAHRVGIEPTYYSFGDRAISNYLYQCIFIFQPLKYG